MAKPVTLSVKTEGTKRAASEIAALRAQVTGSGSSAKQASGEWQAWGQILGHVQTQIADGKAYDELRVRVDQARDSWVEFGAGAQEVATMLGVVSQQAERTGEPLARVVKAAEYLVDESEQLAKAQKMLGLTLDFAARAMEKTEDAGRLLGKAMRGDTAALRLLGPVAKSVADALDLIPDPALRAKMTVQALKEEMGAGQRDADRLATKLGKLEVQIAKTGWDAYEQTAEKALTRLKQMGPASARVATQIEKIRDPAEKARQATAALAEQQRRGLSATQKLRDAHAKGQAKLERWKAEHEDAVTVLRIYGRVAKASADVALKAAKKSAQGVNALNRASTKLALGGLKVLTAAGSAAGAMIGGFLLKSVKDYLTHSNKMKRDVTALKRGFQEFMFTLGGTVVQAGNLDEVMKVVTKGFKEASRWVKDNKDKIGEWVKAAVEGATKFAEAAIFLGGGLVRFFSLAYELARDSIKSIVSLFSLGDFGKEIVHALHSAGALTYEQMKAMETLFIDLKKFGEGDKFNFDMTSKLDAQLAEFEKGAKSFLGDIRDAANLPTKDDKLGSDKRRTDEAKKAADKEIEMMLRTAKMAESIRKTQWDGELQGFKELIEAKSRMRRDALDAWHREWAAKDLESRTLRAKEELKAIKRSANANFVSGVQDNLFSSSMKELREQAKRLDKLKADKASGKKVGASDEEIDRARASVAGQIRLYEQVKSAGVDAAAGIGMAFGETFALMATGSAGAGEVLQGTLFGALKSIVPIMSAYGSMLISAANMNGIGVLIGAGVLSGLLGAAEAAFQHKSGPSASSTSAADRATRRFRQEREKDQQTMIFNLHYGSDFVEQQIINTYRRSQQLHQVRQNRRAI